RSNWMAHAITNWMGDDGWIGEFQTNARMFNFHGDTSLITGRVIGKRVEDDRYLADLDLRCANQRDEVTMIAKATVILPSKERGPVLLPRADNTLIEAGSRMMLDAAQRIRAKTR